jgi:serine protease Do
MEGENMRRHVPRGLFWCVVLLAGLGLSSPCAMAAGAWPSMADLVATLLPAVVSIQTTSTNGSTTIYSNGSGFIIEPSGIIVTNRHVIAGAFDIVVTVPNLPPLRATPMFISTGIDLALLKVDAGQPLPTVKLGDSDAVRIGDPVALIGNALGVGESLSVGVVSALNRDIGESLYDHFIQTDAALNHGNSGGPMFNAAGEVIGINTSLISSQNNTGSVGIGFSMPINDAKFVIDQFLRTQTVIGGSSAGVHGQRMTDELAAAFGLDSARGAIITGVEEGSTAAGKLRVGDIILQVGAQDASDTRAVARLIAVTPPGQSLDVRLLRDGVEQTVTITVAKAEYDPKPAMAYLGHAPEQSKVFATPSNPGVGLAVIDPETRKKFGINAGQRGVVVISVDPRGVAADRKIVVGDVILSVGDSDVGTPEDVRRELREVSDRHRPFAALLVAGERSTRWVALPLAADR